ncbi:hypothetical protein ACMA1I_11985 [Pontibacter sp. 13R65]|uniref:hypothetical protein n=1 Tax=Pontibacter sp. 13R65 TaxID=3127458 RepID=UPI00301CC666
MKKHLSYLVSILVTAAFVSSCKDCTDPVITPLEQTDVEWLAYNELDSVHFKTEKNEIVTFKKVTARADNIVGEGSQVGDDCIASMDTQALIMLSSESGQHPVIGTSVLRRPNKLFVRIMVSPQDSGFEINQDFPTYPSLQVGDFVHQDVYELKQDSTRALSIKQLLYNKNRGILRVEYYNGRYYEVI